MDEQNNVNINNNETNDTNFFIETFKKNPMASLNLLEIIFLIFPAYNTGNTMLRKTVSVKMFSAAFENTGKFSYIFQIFVVLSPFIMLIVPFIHPLEKIKSLLLKIVDTIGIVGTITLMHMIKTAQKVTKGTEFEIKMGIAPWIILILFIIQLIYIFVMYDNNKNGTTLNEPQIVNEANTNNIETSENDVEISNNRNQGEENK